MLMKQKDGVWKNIPAYKVPLSLPERITGGLVRSFTVLYYNFNPSTGFGIPMKPKDISLAFRKIALMPAESLIPHEKTILARMSRNIVDSDSTGFWSCSVVDVAPLGKNKALILNGHHKHEKANERGLVSVPVFRLENYKDFLLSTRFPILSETKSIEQLGGVKSPYKKAIRSLHDRTSYFVAEIKGNRAYYVFPSASTDLKNIISQQETLINRLGPDTAYLHDIVRAVSQDTHEFSVLIRIPLKSSEVMSLAQEGMRLPPKTTRHDFDMRAKLEVSLELLKMPFAEANRVFEEMRMGISQYLESLQVFNIEVPKIDVPQAKKN